MIRLFLIVLLVLPASLQAAELYLPDKQQALEFKESDEQLFQKYGLADESCRGGNPNTLDMWVACADRDLLKSVIANRGYCFGGKDDTGAAVMRWHKCGKDSLPM